MYFTDRCLSTVHDYHLSNLPLHNVYILAHMHQISTCVPNTTLQHYGIRNRFSGCWYCCKLPITSNWLTSDAESSCLCLAHTCMAHISSFLVMLIWCSMGCMCKSEYWSLRGYPDQLPCSLYHPTHSLCIFRVLAHFPTLALRWQCPL
jgi:hypothetical protein